MSASWRWPVGLVGGAAVAIGAIGAAVFWLTPRACACTDGPDPESYRGLDGVTLGAELGYCDPAEGVAPDPEAVDSWWTLTEEPAWSTEPDSDIATLAAVPWDAPGATPVSFEVHVGPEGLGSGLPLDMAALHVATSAADEDGIPTALFGVTETGWGAAFFSGGCAEVALRWVDDQRGLPTFALTDAEVASYPGLDAGARAALAEPRASSPGTITGASVDTPLDFAADGRDVLRQARVLVSLSVEGDPEPGDVIALVVPEGAGDAADLASESDLLSAGDAIDLEGRAIPGDPFAVVLTRDFTSSVVAEVSATDALEPGARYEATVTLDYTDLRRTRALDGSVALLPAAALGELLPAS